MARSREESDDFRKESHRFNRFSRLAQTDRVLAEHLRFASKGIDGSSSRNASLPLRYARAFGNALLTSPEISARDLIQRVRAIKGLPVGPLDELGTAEHFPVGSAGSLNPAYLGLVWLFRCAPKKDYHCHISEGLHERDIAEIMVANPQHLDRMLETIKDKHIPAGQTKVDYRAAALRGEVEGLTELLLQNPKLNQVWGRKDFIVVDLDILREVTKRVALRLMLDGEEEFELRLNPLKLDTLPERERGRICGGPPEQAMVEIARRNLAAINQGIEEAIAEAEQIYQLEINPGRIRVLFSINRWKQYAELRDKPAPEVAAILFENMDRLSEVCPRIGGLDISGEETGIDDYVPNAWQRAVQVVEDSGLVCVTHLGDIYYLKEGSKLLSAKELAESQLEQGDRDSFTANYYALTRAYQRFILETLGVLPAGARIGHGYGLSLEYFLGRFIDFRRYKDMEAQILAGLPSPIRTTADEILTQIQQRRFQIEICPAQYFDFLPDSGQLLPVHNFAEAASLWTPHLVPIRLGIDGIWFYSRPRTVSEESSRIFLSTSDSTEPFSFAEVLAMTAPTP